MNPSGWDEWTTVEIGQAGHHCVAVWKVASGDVPKAGSYELIFQPGVTDVPGGEPGGDSRPPGVTALREIWPNPFNPATRVAFDLARAGLARLDIHDARGRLVRRLVAEDLPAGRHERVWDGRDDGGQAVASGTYFARLAADGRLTMKTMLLMK
jgi:hypothetical protein